MGKSWLHRCFGLGAIPETLRRELLAEDLLVWDEGLRTSVHYRGYRSTHLRSGRGRKGIPGYVALTRVRLVAKGYFEYSSVPLAGAGPELSYGLRGPSCFWFAYEASRFYEDRSGRVEHRIHTSRAAELAQRLSERPSTFDSRRSANAPGPSTHSREGQ